MNTAVERIPHFHYPVVMTRYYCTPAVRLVQAK